MVEVFVVLGIWSVETDIIGTELDCKEEVWDTGVLPRGHLIIFETGIWLLFPDT